VKWFGLPEKEAKKLPEEIKGLLKECVLKEDFEKSHKLQIFMLKKERKETQKTIKHLQDQIGFWVDREARKQAGGKE